MNARAALVAACGLALLTTGCARHAASQRTVQRAALLRAAAQPPLTFDGEQIYAADCASCHGDDGQGWAGVFPSLTGNPRIIGNPTPLIDAVKNGERGTIIVEGERYDGVMPPWGGVLTDEQIAATLSYIRDAWGNVAPAVTTDAVARVPSKSHI